MSIKKRHVTKQNQYYKNMQTNRMGLTNDTDYDVEHSASKLPVKICCLDRTISTIVHVIKVSL